MIISYVWSAAFLQGIRFADFKNGRKSAIHSTRVGEKCNSKMIISYVRSAAFLQVIRFADFKGGRKSEIHFTRVGENFKGRGLCCSHSYQDDCNKKNPSQATMLTFNYLHSQTLPRPAVGNDLDGFSKPGTFLVPAGLPSYKSKSTANSTPQSSNEP